MTHNTILLMVSFVIVGAGNFAWGNCRGFARGSSFSATRAVMSDHLLYSKRRTLELIDKLRQDEGNMVGICADNADFNGRPNCAIACCGQWTEWTDRTFFGDTVLRCLEDAWTAYQAANA